jgi:hypothetical protein
MLLLHEIIELVKALAWPSVAMFFLVYFRRQIRSMLTELPGMFRRMRSANALGVTLELDGLEADLTIAQQETAQLRLPPGQVPSRAGGME